MKNKQDELIAIKTAIMLITETMADIVNNPNIYSKDLCSEVVELQKVTKLLINGDKNEKKEEG